MCDAWMDAGASGVKCSGGGGGGGGADKNVESMEEPSAPRGSSSFLPNRQRHLSID